MERVQVVSAQHSSLIKIVEALVAALGPATIILFGIWARGDQRPDSEFDIFVELSTGTALGEASRKGYEALHPITDFGKTHDLQLMESCHV